MGLWIKFILILSVFIVIPTGTLLADINIFLGDLNNQAYSNRNDYSYRLSNQFGVPLYQVDSIIKRVHSPADAFMCLQLSRMLNIPHQRVLETYQANSGQGWGVTAQKLGIKPGSPEFHALKRGDYTLTGTPYPSHHGKKKEHGKEMEFSGYEDVQGDNQGQGQGKGNDKGKGKGKGNNK